MRWLIGVFLTLTLILFPTGARADSLINRLDSYPVWSGKPPINTTLPDLVYPDRMAGTWRVKSTLIDLRSPLSPEVITPGFEGNRRYLEKTIDFNARFIPKKLSLPIRSSILSNIINRESIVADRVFNGLSIGRAYLGDGMILSVKTAPDNPDRQITFLKGDRQLISTVIGRNQQKIDENRFITSEISEQYFRGGDRPYFNGVETTTAYNFLGEDRILAEQVTAIYLSPEDPDYFKAIDRPVALYRYRMELTRTEP